MTGGMELTEENQRFIEQAFSRLLHKLWRRNGLDTQWWADFVRADQMGWTFRTTHHIGTRMFCANRDESTGWVEDFQSLLIEVMNKTSAECYDKPEIARLRAVGWKCEARRGTGLTQAASAFT